MRGSRRGRSHRSDGGQSSLSTGSGDQYWPISAPAHNFEDLGRVVKMIPSEKNRTRRATRHPSGEGSSVVTKKESRNGRKSPGNFVASRWRFGNDRSGASDDTTGGVVSSDAALSGLGVASKPVVWILAATLGFYNLPEWAAAGPPPDSPAARYSSRERRGEICLAL